MPENTQKEAIDVVDYGSIFSELKEKVLHSQQKAVSSVNKELVVLYWEIGNAILQHQKSKGWGAKIIDSLSDDLRKSFPTMKGFSVRNLKYMRQFASTYKDLEFVQEVLAQLSWYHNITLIQKINNPDFKGVEFDGFRKGAGLNNFKEQLKRNIEKFPKDYGYQVSGKELQIKVSHNATPWKQELGGLNPWVFADG